MDADVDGTTGRRPTPPWLFLLLLIPLGVTSGHASVGLPYLLSRHGVPASSVAALVSLTFVPHAWKPLWTPLLDCWLRRKHWHILCSALATIGTVVAFLLPPNQHLGLLSGVLVLVNIAAATSQNALGGVCATTVRADQKGRASGFFSAGQLLSAGAAGGLILELSEPHQLFGVAVRARTLGEIGVVLGIIMVASTLVALRIDEPPPDRRPLWPHLRALLLSTWETVRTRQGWTGLLICLSPVGTVAAQNIFGTLAADFHASARQVNLATGLPAGLASALGSVLGGVLADRMNRRSAYLLGGAFTALCAVGMALSAPLPSRYIFWCLAYAVGGGLAYATFYAFTFEMIPQRSVGATTTYGVFAGTANLAIAYTIYADGAMYQHGGRVGLLLTDAAMTVLGIALVSGLLYLTGGLTRAQRAPAAPAPPAPAPPPATALPAPPAAAPPR